MNRRRRYRSLLMLLLFTAFAYGAGSASPIYKISISLPKQTFRLGEPVLAHVSLKNVSDGMITIGFAIGFQQAEASYRITLTDKLGHQLTPRWSIREAGQISKPFVFSRSPMDLAPNETLEEDCLISNVFVLNTLGEYTLEFTRSIPGSDKQFVHSNTLVFSIVK